MSSMRNAVQRRNHKERAQPLEREKWGLLEKRKDYKLRAADHRQKKQKLKLLSEKARDRNPDEFSFKMMSSKVDKQGKKIADRGNMALSLDVVKLLKTQDAGYIRTMLQMVRKEREELEQKLIVEEGEARALRDGERSKSGKHKVYVNNEEEQKEFDPDTWFGRGEDMPGRGDNLENEDENESEEEVQIRQKPLSKKQIEAEELERRQQRTFQRSRLQSQSRVASRLEAMKRKERELVAAENELELQRSKMNNTVGGVNKHGVKFKLRERKR